MWREWPERNCEVHQLIGLIADSDDFRIGIRYSARLVFFFGDIVDNVFLCVLVVGPRHVHWTYYIDLVILELDVPFVHVYNMVCIVDAKYAIGGVPVDVEGPGGCRLAEER